MTDLVQTIVEAATEAIRNRQAAITSGAKQLRSVHLELEVANGGQVVEATTYLEWKQTIRRPT